MKKPISFLKIAGYFIAAMFILFFLYAAGDKYRPLYQALQLRSGGKVLGREKICEDLLKGDYAAASEPIKLKAESREYSFADIVTWLAKKGDAPYMLVPRSPLFTELPADQGALQTCRGGESASLGGDHLSASISLGYPRSRVTVTLRYLTGWRSPTLQRIEIGKPEPTGPGAPPQDETDRRMSEFMNELRQKEK